MAFPDLKGTITGIVSSGNQVVAEIEWDGTLTGPLMAPTGRIEPTGRRGVVKAAEVFIFEGSRIKYMRHYFDMMDILRQAGALPAA
jgi:predicted ester cyclase